MENISNVEEYVQQAKMLVRAQKYEEAVVYADKALEEDKMCFDAWVLKGIALADSEAYEEAKGCFQKGIMIDKKAPAPHYHLSVVHFIEGNVEEGIKASNQAIELGYDEQDIYFNLGLVYESEGDDDKAIRNYNKAIKKDELNPYPHLRKAMVYLNSAQYAAGLEALEALRKNCPDCYEGYHYAAAAYLAMGDANGADELLKSAEDMFHEDVDIVIDRIKVLVALNKSQEALDKIENIMSAVENEEQNKELLIAKAKIVGLEERYDETISLLEESLKLVKDESLDAEAHYLLINAYLMREDYEKVKVHALELSELPDTNTYALGAQYYVAMAEARLHPENMQDVYKKAIFYYRSLTLQNPNRVEAYLFRAVCYKEMGDYEKAMEMVNYVTNFTTDIPGLDVIKASILDYMGKKDDAKNLLEGAAAKGEDVAQIMLDNQE